MTWVSMGKAPVVSHPQILVMLRRAVADAPGDARRQRALARELFGLGEYAEAVPAFERLLSLAGDLGEDWASLGIALLDTAGSAAVLDLCATRWPTSEAGAGTADRHYVAAQALRRGGRIAEAHADFERAISLGGAGNEALRALLRMHAEQGDGQALLDVCDRHAGAGAIGAVRGYRALALSLLGQDDAATALVDLDAGTMRYRFEPPGGVDLATFNDALAQAILADQPAGSGRHDVLLNHAIQLPASVELAALQDFIRASYDDYVARFAGHGFMPPIAGATRLDFGAVTVRRQGRNGQHVHPDAWLTGVYHVRVPEMLEGEAGALVTGVCDEIAPGHQSCWGTRVLPAVPGMLTIFPAHYFHDVRPTGVEERRVVVVSDLMSA